MISKAQIKYLRLLHHKKYRDEEGLFIAEGPKIVNDLLNSEYKAWKIYATKEYKLLQTGVKIENISEKILEQISTLSTSHQVFGVFQIPSRYLPSPPALSSELILALDDIRDPGNFGTIIRTADWFGINHILCSETCVDLYNPKVVQAAMGSMARVNLYYVNLEKILFEFKQVYAAVLAGNPIYSEKLSDKGVILIGNESRGISENLMKCVLNKICIPNFSTGADSLNAAVATAVICSEFRSRYPKENIKKPSG